MSRRRAYRVGDPIPADAVEFVHLVRQLPPEKRQAITACAFDITTRPVALSGHEKIRRLMLALGYSEFEAAAHAMPLRRDHLRVV